MQALSIDNGGIVDDKFNVDFLKENDVYFKKNEAYVMLGRPERCSKNMCEYENLMLILKPRQITLYCNFPAHATKSSAAPSFRNASGKKRRKTKSNKKQKKRNTMKTK